MASTLYGTYYASYSLALAYVTSVYAYDQYAPESMGGQLVNNYKLGFINDEEFKQKMSARLRISQDQVALGWNAGLGLINNGDCASLAAFLTTHAEAKVVFVGNTNGLHYNTFKQRVYGASVDLYNILSNGVQVINNMSFVTHNASIQASIENICDDVAEEGKIFSFNRYAQAPQDLGSKSFEQVAFNYPNDASTLGEKLRGLSL